MMADDIVHILAAGGNVSLSAQARDVHELRRIAATAAEHKRTLVIRDAALPIYDLAAIVTAGRGYVTLEV